MAIYIESTSGTFNGGDQTGLSFPSPLVPPESPAAASLGAFGQPLVSSVETAVTQGGAGATSTPVDFSVFRIMDATDNPVPTVADLTGWLSSRDSATTHGLIAVSQVVTASPGGDRMIIASLKPNGGSGPDSQQVVAAGLQTVLFPASAVGVAAPGDLVFVGMNMQAWTVGGGVGRSWSPPTQPIANVTWI